MLPGLAEQMAQQRIRFSLMLDANPEAAQAVLDVANEAMRALGF